MSQTVTYPGSGLVFVNTYTASVTPAYQADIIQAENYLQSQFSNSLTVNVTFDWASLNNSNAVAHNDFATTTVYFSDWVNALAARATSPDQQAAVNSLKNMEGLFDKIRSGLAATQQSDGGILADIWNDIVKVGVAVTDIVNGVVGAVTAVVNVLSLPQLLAVDGVQELFSLLGWGSSPDLTAQLRGELANLISGYVTLPAPYANMLGLNGPTVGGPAGTDEYVTISNNNGWTTAGTFQNANSTAGVIEHELSEGVMGRIGALGVPWEPMDYFRYTANGVLDVTGDGQPTYFAPAANTTDPNTGFFSQSYTGLQYFNPKVGIFTTDGGDSADWTNVGDNANSTDPFGPNNPGGSDPGTLSETDLRILNVLGWTRTAPPTVTLSLVSPGLGGNITNEQTVTGKADPNVDVDVTVSSQDGTLVYSGTVLTDGNGVFAPLAVAGPQFAPLWDGQFTISASETSAHSGLTGSASLTFTVATQSPTVSATGSVSGLTGQTSDTINITATAENVPGDGISKVEVFDGITELGVASQFTVPVHVGPLGEQTVQVPIPGEYTFTASGLSAGVHDLIAVATDLAGNRTTVSVPEVSVATGTPSVSGPTPQTADTFQISTASNISSVEVFDGSKDLGAAAQVEFPVHVGPLGGQEIWVPIAGSYIFTASGLSDSAHVFSAVVTDATGSTATIFLGEADVATQAPTLSATASVSGLTNQAADTITATASAELVANNAIAGVEIFDGATDLGAAALANGVWSYTASNLADGAHDLSAVATDMAGNKTSAALMEVDVATQAPTVSATQSVSGSTNQTSDTITVTAGAEQVANNIIAGVEIYDGATDLGAAIFSNGVWSYTASNLSHGAHDFSAVVTDAAGNAASAALAAVDVTTGAVADDFSGDGVSDLLIENTSGAVVVGEVQNGAESYTQVAALGPEWSFKGNGDFLGDGHEDFLIVNSSGAVVVGQVDNGATSYTQVGALGSEWSFVGTGDLLGSGQADFLIENSSGAVVVGSVVNGQAQYTQVAALGPEWSFEGTGDFLGDGKTGFLIENTSGAVVVGEAENGATTYTQIGGLGPEWKFVGTGDFLGNGQAQFLIENSAGAGVVGSVVNGQARYTQVVALGPEWSLIGTGDYLGSGTADFMIENTSGAVVLGGIASGQARYAQVGALGPEWTSHS
jgi:hypothetical protein